MKQFVLVTIVAVMSMVFTCPVFAGEWIPCAREHQNCTVPGTKMVRYGADDRWTNQLVTHKIYCGNEAFGDPAPGARKACYYREHSPSDRPEHHRRHQPRWEKCANEGHYCKFRGQMTVSYGAGDRWTRQTATDGIRCGNDIFGDPAPGARKACYIMVD